MSTQPQAQSPILTAQTHAQALDRSFHRLLNILALLEADEIEHARLPGGWTPKTLVAHVGFWDHIQTERMMAALVGPDAQAAAPWPATDNDARAAADANRPWGEILAEATAARQRMVDFAAGLSPDILAATYPERTRVLSINELLVHMAGHVQEHADELMGYCGSLDRWGRAGWRGFLVHQHRNLMDAIGGMSEAWLVSQQVMGEWTPRDVLAHVLYWEEFAWAVTNPWPTATSEDLAHWIVPDEDEDATNARLLAEKSDYTLIDILDWLTTYHRRTLRTFDGMSDDDLRSVGETGFGRDSFIGFLYSMAMHGAEHAAEIWRARP